MRTIASDEGSWDQPSFYNPAMTPSGERMRERDSYILSFNEMTMLWSEDGSLVVRRLAVPDSHLDKHIVRPRRRNRF